MKRLIYCLIFLCILIKSTAQGNYVDSLEALLSKDITSESRIEVLNELSREMLRISPDHALETINTLKHLADSIQSPLANAHYYRLMAGLNAMQGNYLYATTFVFQAIRLYEHLKDSSGIANSYIALANNYSRQRMYAQAVQYQKKALNLFEGQGDRRRMSICLSNLTFLFNQLGEYDSALMMGRQSMTINTTEKHQSVLLNDYKNLGFTYLNKKEYANALQNFEEALRLNAQLGNRTNTEAITETLVGLGRLNYETGNKKRAFEYLQQAVSKADSNDFYTWKRDGLYLLAEYHAKEGNFRQAYDFLRQHTAIVDSLSQKQRSERSKLGDVYLDALRESYQYDLLKEEEALKAEIIRKQRLELLFGTSAIIVLLIFVYYLKRSNIRRRNINDMLNEQKEEVARRKLELEKLNQTKDRFFSIVAHDLRSPMNSLKSFASFIHQHGDRMSKEEIIHVSGQIESAVDNTVKMLDNLMTWARLQMQEERSVPETLELKTVIEEELEVYVRAAELKKIKIEQHVPGDMKVFADKNQVMFIVRNLVNNAIKFTNVKGTITLSATRVGNDHVKLAVADNGIGMEPETLRNIFRLRSKSTVKGTAGEKGTGLGLILCQQFAAQNCGKIGVESEPQRGSVFYLQLPTPPALPIL